MRTFVAIEIEDDLRQKLALLQQRLGRATDGVRWVKPAAMHFTAKFLGEVPDVDVPGASDIVKQCAADTPPFRVTLCGLGGFPDARRPRVIWVGARDEPSVMQDLHHRLDRALNAIGVPREGRPFRSHLTVGRVRRPGVAGGIAQAVETFAEHVFGTFEVGELVFMQSELTPAGPLYTPLSRHALGRGTC